MAKHESTEDEQALSNTVKMFYPGWRRYAKTRYTERWYVGVGAYLDLAKRVENLEGAMRHGVSPTIRQIMTLLERYAERDAVPAAGSGAYEWQSQLRKVANTVENMLEVFDDLEERLSCYVDLTRQVGELLKLARFLGNRNVRDAVLTLHDALCGTYSEDLSSTQAEAIESAVNHLYDLNLNREQVSALDRELRKSGLETVPSDRFVGLYRERSHT